MHVPAAPLRIQLPTDGPGKAEDGPPVWSPASHVGDPGEGPGPWLQPSLALIIAATGGVN